MKKNILFTSIVLILVLISTSVFAATVSSKNATFEIVENNTATIKITDNASFEKKIIDYNLDKKEITLELSIVNNAAAPLDKPSEIVLLIDNSLSMKNTISTGGTRMEAVADSAKLLAKDLLKLDTVKLSVVSFSTVDNGNKLPGSEGYIEEGTLADAKLRTPLTTSEQTILNAIDEVANDATGIRTDIEAGLTLASQQFSGTCESQVIILLTDGVPNISLGTNKIEYSGTTATNTKNALTKLNSQNIRIFSMMTGVTDDVADEQGNTYRDLAEEIFGTPSNPTVGKFYYITDAEIEETVSKTILNDLMAPEGELLTDIDIYDYMPQQIVDNFTFEYVQQPTKGTASEDIDLQNNMITWHIDELGYGEKASLAYKLTLKDNIDEDILNVVLNTTQKIEITTNKLMDENGEKQVLTSTVTPKVRVNVAKPTPTPTPDTTVAPTPIPQTGVTITLFVLIAAAVITSIVLFVKSKKVK